MIGERADRFREEGRRGKQIKTARLEHPVIDKNGVNPWNSSNKEKDRNRGRVRDKQR